MLLDQLMKQEGTVSNLLSTLRILRPAAIVLTVLLLAGSGASLRAQVLKAQVLGTISDTSGAVIPGTQIVLTEMQTNSSRASQTNESGLYVFTNLDPGLYQVEAETEGFRRALRGDIDVRPNTTVRVNIELEPGVVTEVVTITDTIPILQTDRADTGGQLVRQQVATMPLGFNRNYQGLLSTVPGINKPIRHHSRFYNSQDNLSVRVNGQGRQDNNFQIEGIENKIDNGNLTALVPPAEAIQTVDISTSNFDPEFGQAAGAVINVTLRSGTNELHGSVFNFHRNDNIQAAEAFATSKAPTTYNQFGGTLGGPIVRNKMFIFGDYQGSRDNLGENNRFSIPNEAFRQGDLSAGGTPIYDPMTGNPDGTGRTAFANMQIPESRISPVSRTLAGFLPPTTLAGTSVNWEGNTTSTKSLNAFDVKYDWNMTDNDRFMFRYSYQKANVVDDGVFGPGGIYGGPRNNGFLGSGPARTQSPGLGYSHIFSPTFITEVRFGIVRNRNDAINTDRGLTTSADIGIPGVNTGDPWTSGLTEIRIPDISGNRPLLGFSGSLPWARSVTLFGLVNNYTLTRQNHIFRWGYDIRRERNDLLQTAPPRGRWTFQEGQTALNGGPPDGFGNSMASFLLDLPDGLTRGVPSRFPTRRAIVYNFYFQDKWQVTQNFTWDLGLRYEIEPGQVPRFDGGFANYNYFNNTVEMAGLGSIPKNMGVLPHHGFAPRIGMAYRLNEKTVLRSGFGISFWPRGASGRQWPIRSSSSYSPVNDFTPALADDGTVLGMGSSGIPPTVFPDVPANGVIPNPPSSNGFTYTQPDRPKGYVQSWNFAFQRALPENFSFEAAYVGSHGVNKDVGVNLNAGQVPGLGSRGQMFRTLFGKSGSVNVRLGTHTYYHGLQAKLNRQFSDGFRLTTSYSFHKSTGFCSDRCSSSVDGLNYFHLNKGRADEDYTHIFVQSYIYELPFGPGKPFLQSGAGRWLLGGWQVNGFLTLQSGAPINITASTSSLQMPSNTNRPDLVGSGKVEILGNIGRGQKFFDVSRFAQPGPARFGTVGRNIMQGPGVVNFDFSLFRNFDFRESVRFQLRIESFNFTNTPQFVNPSGNSSSSTFAEVTRTSPNLSDPQARRFQIGLKLSF